MVGTSPLKLTLEPTTKFFRTDDGYPVRAWIGSTSGGCKVVAFISAISAAEGQDHSELARELEAIPGPNAQGFIVWPPGYQVQAEAAYRSDRFPERPCERCGKIYRGPAVYCSLSCAVEDA
jgi:hypothetical protein